MEGLLGETVEQKEETKSGPHMLINGRGKLINGSRTCSKTLALMSSSFQKRTTYVLWRMESGLAG